jgi:hypothetical protein
LRIGTGLVELAPDQIISTTTCNGQFPGPLLRFKEGQSVTADVFNDFRRDGEKPSFSKWGRQSVQLFAPGDKMYSTQY